MRRCTIISSLTSEKQMTQAGLVYLATGLANAGYDSQLIDLSGKLSYFNPPDELYSSCDSPLWLNPDAIKYSEWMDSYIPTVDEAPEIIFFSSLFSPDVVFHARYSYNIKAVSPKTLTAIGGAALAGLRIEQLEIIRQYFDYVFIGHDVEAFLKYPINNNIITSREGRIINELRPSFLTPNYSLVDLRDFVTVYSGHGCYYGKCNFCDYPARASQEVYFKDCTKVAIELLDIYNSNPKVKDIVLTQDCYTKKKLIETTNALLRQGGHIPYNLMLRAEPWIDKEIGEMLALSGCTDVFIGAEALDDDILQVLNKGITTENIIDSIMALSKHVDITIGIILFVPMINEKSLGRQLHQIENILPYINNIEPEILTIMNGSGFALKASSYGITLNATENLLNDSWCYGLSQDIPWAMIDQELAEAWFRHIDKLKEICGDRVKKEYWEAVDNVRESNP